VGAPFEIVVISPPEDLSGEGAIVNELFRAGLTRFYLRKGGVSRGELVSYIGAIEPSFLGRVVIGSHFELIDEFGLGGAHLPTEARLNKSIFAQWVGRRTAEGKRLSTSVHSADELTALGANFDFTFFSPVFGSISKGLPRGGFTDGELREAACGGVNAVYALGGISRETIRGAQDLGFSGCGVIGAVWESSDPVAAFRGLQREVTG
jgi:thiamine-phosphate pyrophosphorylase